MKGSWNDVWREAGGVWWRKVSIGWQDGPPGFLFPMPCWWWRQGDPPSTPKSLGGVTGGLEVEAALHSAVPPQIDGVMVSRAARPCTAPG